MGDPQGFLRSGRCAMGERAVAERLLDWREFVLEPQSSQLTEQASRCMECGIPFCHHGCPLGNLIPEWNDHVYRGRMDRALVALSATNNFPEITGRICPAPCEAACVLNIGNEPVNIKAIEKSIATYALERGLTPQRAAQETGRRVAVVGSGPAGLAAAQQLARAGHAVTVFERDSRVGGLLRFGIPDFKLEKLILDARIEQMRQEGIVFTTDVVVGVDLSADELRHRFDAVVLAMGARKPRDLPVPGRQLQGVHFAMDYLAQQNERVAGGSINPLEAIWAEGKRVVVIGGGDTGSDCVGTANRQKAASVLQLELLPQPPQERSARNPWPEWPNILRTSSSHKEGCQRQWSVMTTAFEGEYGRLTQLRVADVEMREGRPTPIPGTERLIGADLVFLAMGFVGPEREGLLEQLGVQYNARGAVKTTPTGALHVPGFFAAGDLARGQSLVVWAIAEGRRVAASVDAYLRDLAVGERAA